MNVQKKVLQLAVNDIFLERGVYDRKSKLLDINKTEKYIQMFTSSLYMDFREYVNDSLHRI